MNNKKNDLKRGLYPYIFLFVFIVVCLFIVNSLNNKINNLKYDEFINYINKDEIKELTIVPKTKTETYQISGKLKK